MFGLHAFRELGFESLKVSPSIIVLGDFEIFLVIHVYGFEDCFRGFCIYVYSCIFVFIYSS